MKARCVRITLQPPEGGELKLEEMTVNGGFPLTERRRGLTVAVEGVSTFADPTPLFDRMINGHALQIPLLRRINLVRRNVLSGELNRVTTAMDAIRVAHRRTVARLNAAAITIATLLVSGAFFLQRRHARNAQQRIRHRIQQDLHDEIGSQLSAISLIADMDQSAPNLQDDVRADLIDINQCAREAVASLAEVV